MRKATRISLTLGTSAADGDENVPPFSTKPSIQVDGGMLSMTVAPALAPAKGFIPGEVAVYAVPAATAMDYRAVKGNWNVSVSMTNFTTDVQDAKPIPAAGSTYKAKEGTVKDTGVTGPLVVTDGAEWKSASEPLPAVSATDVFGNNTLGWEATLTVPVPDDALAGTYTATLTHSFL